jgi:hypothetical protein
VPELPVPELPVPEPPAPEKHPATRAQRLNDRDPPWGLRLLSSKQDAGNARNPIAGLRKDMVGMRRAAPVPLTKGYGARRKCQQSLELLDAGFEHFQSSLPLTLPHLQPQLAHRVVRR